MSTFCYADLTELSVEYGYQTAKACKTLPKLPVARRRTVFEAKHAPANNLYRPLTCETAIAVDAQIKAASINPTSVLRKVDNHLAKSVLDVTLRQASACNEASHALVHESRTILPKSVSMSMG